MFKIHVPKSVHVVTVTDSGDGWDVTLETSAIPAGGETLLGDGTFLSREPKTDSGDRNVPTPKTGDETFLSREVKTETRDKNVPSPSNVHTPELDADRKRKQNAERQRRFRERNRNALRNAKSNAPSVTCNAESNAEALREALPSVTGVDCLIDCNINNINNINKNTQTNNQTTLRMSSVAKSVTPRNADRNAPRNAEQYVIPWGGKLPEKFQTVAILEAWDSWMRFRFSAGCRPLTEENFQKCVAVLEEVYFEGRDEWTVRVLNWNREHGQLHRLIFKDDYRKELQAEIEAEIREEAEAERKREEQQEREETAEERAKTLEMIRNFRLTGFGRNQPVTLTAREQTENRERTIAELNRVLGKMKAE